jgi:hypothetical protein
MSKKVYGVNPIDSNSLVFLADFSNNKIFNPSDISSINSLGKLPGSYLRYPTGIMKYDEETRSIYRSDFSVGADHYRSSTKVNLGQEATFHVITKAVSCGSSANGILTNHSHGDKSGLGITIRVTNGEYRISCNTGTGASRTYYTYFGSTNIRNKWVLLSLSYKNGELCLYVNGVLDRPKINYPDQINIEDYIDILGWSTTYSSSNYKPGAYVMYASVYNRGFSDEEVSAFYDSIKHKIP